MTTPTPPPPSPRYFTSPRFAPYRDALARISARTGASVPSLAASFLVLHEITAIIPFVGVFYASRALGVGEQVVESMTRDDENGDAAREAGLIKKKTREWVDEGGQMAQRLGYRYGLFGIEKGERGVVNSGGEETSGSKSTVVGTKIAGDVANVVVAYAVTKAILPVRVGVSLYLSPSFSRLVFEPLRKACSRAFSGIRSPKPPSS